MLPKSLPPPVSASLAAGLLCSARAEGGASRQLLESPRPARGPHSARRMPQLGELGASTAGPGAAGVPLQKPAAPAPSLPASRAALGHALQQRFTLLASPADLRALSCPSSSQVERRKMRARTWDCGSADAVPLSFTELMTRKGTVTKDEIRSGLMAREGLGRILAPPGLGHDGLSGLGSDGPPGLGRDGPADAAADTLDDGPRPPSSGLVPLPMVESGTTAASGEGPRWRAVSAEVVELLAQALCTQYESLDCAFHSINNTGNGCITRLQLDRSLQMLEQAGAFPTFRSSKMFRAMDPKHVGYISLDAWRGFFGYEGPRAPTPVPHVRTPLVPNTWQSPKLPKSEPLDLEALDDPKRPTKQAHHLTNATEGRLAASQRTKPMGVEVRHAPRKPTEGALRKSTDTAQSAVAEDGMLEPLEEQPLSLEPAELPVPTPSRCFTSHSGRRRAAVMVDPLDEDLDEVDALENTVSTADVSSILQEVLGDEGPKRLEFLDPHNTGRISMRRWEDYFQDLLQEADCSTLWNHPFMSVLRPLQKFKRMLRNLRMLKPSESHGNSSSAVTKLDSKQSESDASTYAASCRTSSASPGFSSEEPSGPQDVPPPDGMNSTRLDTEAFVQRVQSELEQLRPDSVKTYKRLNEAEWSVVRQVSQKLGLTVFGGGGPGQCGTVEVLREGTQAASVRADLSGLEPGHHQRISGLSKPLTRWTQELAANLGLAMPPGGTDLTITNGDLDVYNLGGSLEEFTDGLRGTLTALGPEATLEFPSGLSTSQRRVFHGLAAELGLVSKTMGKGGNQHVVVGNLLEFKQRVRQELHELKPGCTKTYQHLSALEDSILRRVVTDLGYDLLDPKSGQGESVGGGTTVMHPETPPSCTLAVSGRKSGKAIRQSVVAFRVNETKDADEDEHQEMRKRVMAVFQRYASTKCGGRPIFMRKPGLNRFVEDALRLQGKHTQQNPLTLRKLTEALEDVFDDTLQLQLDMGAQLSHGLSLEYFQVFLSKAQMKMGWSLVAFLYAILMKGASPNAPAAH